MKHFQTGRKAASSFNSFCSLDPKYMICKICSDLKNFSPKATLKQWSRSGHPMFNVEHDCRYFQGKDAPIRKKCLNLHFNE